MEIIIADYQPQILSALRLMVEQYPNTSIVAEVNKGDTILELVKEKTPDLLLLNWELPGLNPVMQIPQLSLRFPSLFIVAISGRPEEKGEAMALGVDLFMHRWQRIDDLLGKMREMRNVKEMR